MAAAGSPSVSHVSDALRAWRARTSGVLTAVAIGSLPILVLEMQRDQLAAADRTLIDVVNMVVLVVFAVDYLVGLSLTSRRSAFVRYEWMELLLVISQALVLFPSLAAFGILRAARLTRLLRIGAAATRLVAIGGIASRQGRAVLRERATSFALGLAVMTWLTSATAFTVVEDVGPDGRIGSFFDALWWSLSTITTVGYGDLFPITTAGRIVGGITMLIGVSVVAILTAKIATFFWIAEAASEPPPTTAIAEHTSDDDVDHAPRHDDDLLRLGPTER